MCHFAPATCPWHHLPALPHSWSRCPASAASASTATREPRWCPRCTGDPNLPFTLSTHSFPTQSLIRNFTGSFTLTSTKRRRIPLATSWWRWGASGTSYVATSTWQPGGRQEISVWFRPLPGLSVPGAAGWAFPLVLPTTMLGVS